ncbi:MAG: FlgD immunoglobulin-like domain containing protein [Candidatus Cloacimonadota bacterium]|nr:FlgD immunoglobulin-like domain containing protein [Candidatus Cloacimonadota bacterium]
MKNYLTNSIFLSWFWKRLFLLPICFLVINFSTPISFALNTTNVKARLVYSSRWKEPFTEKQKGQRSGGKFDVLVNSAVYDSLENHLLQYSNDLENENEPYDVSIYDCDINSPDSLRNFLRQEYEQDNIAGAIFVGQFPHVMYQGMASMGTIYQEFPTETFFRDVDGSWLDTLMYDPDTNTLIPGSDGIYDTHIDGNGDRETEIYLGRIDASNLTYGNNIFGGEIQRLTNYFEKNHSYRIEELTSSDSALIYFDDWAYHQAPSAILQLGQVYPNIVAISDTNETTADDYNIRLQQGYQLIWLAAHSNSMSHGFQANGEWDNIFNSEIPGINPQTLFYLINGCYSGWFINPDCMLNHYVFSSDKGQISIGYSARAPSPVGIYDMDGVGFFSTLGNEGNFGESLNEIIDLDILNQGQDPWKPNGYAMVLLGDPTLKPRYGNVGVDDWHHSPIANVLYQNYPNPFNPDKIGTTTISFHLATDLHPSSAVAMLRRVDRLTQIKIYNLKGQLVRNFSIVNHQSSIIWDGRDENGNQLSNGIYFYQLKTENYSEVKKMILIR